MALFAPVTTIGVAGFDADTASWPYAALPTMSVVFTLPPVAGTAGVTSPTVATVAKDQVGDIATQAARARAAHARRVTSERRVQNFTAIFPLVVEPKGGPIHSASPRMA